MGEYGFAGDHDLSEADFRFRPFREVNVQAGAETDKAEPFRLLQLRAFLVFGIEVGELQLSAISEAMNQMMGASATSMSVMLSEMVDISTPEVSTIDVDSIKTFEKIFEDGLEAFVKISFKLDVENLIDSSMVQFYPISFARDMCRMFKENGEKLAMEA